MFSACCLGWEPCTPPPSPLSFFLILLSFVLSTSVSLSFSFSLFSDLPSCRFDSSEGNYDESGWVGTKSAFLSSNERTNYSLPFFILSTLFLVFRWCPGPCCFCKCWKTLRYSWTFDRDSLTGQTQIDEPCVYLTQKANSVLYYFICTRDWIFMNPLCIMYYVAVYLSAMVNKVTSTCLSLCFGY